MIENQKLTQKTEKNSIVIYHKNCFDGYGAAWAAYKKYGNDAVYIAASDRLVLPIEVTTIIENNLSTNLEHKNNHEDSYSKQFIDIYVLDFCYSKENIKILEDNFKTLTVLDHHVSAKENIESAKNHVYSETKSGAYISWQYFHADTSVPILIDYISDADTWNRTKPDWQYVESYIYNQDLDFGTFDAMNDMIESQKDRVLEIGKVLSRVHQKRVEMYLEKAEIVSFEGYDVWAVNAPSDIRNELGHEMATRTGTFGLVFYYENENWKCSLRSVEDFDVTTIAIKYGGGGHKNASGFIVKTDFPLPFVKKSSL